MNIEMTTTARSGTGNGVKEFFKKIYEKIDTSDNKRNKLFMLLCAVALAIDPLFLFIPEIDYQKSCIGFDETLRETVTYLRSIIDLMCALAIILCQTSLRGNMGRRTRHFYSIIDFLSVFPIHVAMVFHFFLNEGSYNLVSKRMLKWTVVAQYIPRIIRMYPSYKAVTKTTVTIAESKWIGALLNLSFFLLCSYVFGAFWYVTAIEKQSTCWHDYWNQTRHDFLNETMYDSWNQTDLDVFWNRTIQRFQNDTLYGFGNETRWIKQTRLSELYCANLDGKSNRLFLGRSCPILDSAEINKPSKTLAGIKNNTQYDFGMYGDVVNSEVGSKGLRDFPKKFFYCFWWGLRNLSNFGENLKPGNSATDIFLAIIMCACGLFLVAILIGNVQKYLLSSTVRSDEMKERKKDTEKWMTFRKLPEDLKKRIKESEKTIWKNVRGTDEESLLRRLPEELRLETQPYLLDD